MASPDPSASPELADRRLVAMRTRAVPPFSDATWGLAMDALARTLGRPGRDEAGEWRSDDGHARLALDHRDGESVLTLELGRPVAGAQIWALPVLFWPFAGLLAVMVARGELPWELWVVPALFGLAPSLLLGARRLGHDAWRAGAARRARRALDAAAAAVAEGNALEARPSVPSPHPPPDDDAWAAPFVAPEVWAPRELWVSAAEAEALAAAVRDGTLGLRPAPTEGPHRAVHVSAERARRGWTQRTLAGGFDEWVPLREPGEARP